MVRTHDYVKRIQNLLEEEAAYHPNDIWFVDVEGHPNVQKGLHCFPSSIGIVNLGRPGIRFSTTIKYPGFTTTEQMAYAIHNSSILSNKFTVQRINHALKRNYHGSLIHGLTYKEIRDHPEQTGFREEQALPVY